MRWRKVPKDEYYKAEAFLRKREKYCVTASARFLKINESRGHVWYLGNPGGEINALLLHCGHSLFPVFDKNSSVPGPTFLSRFLGKVHIHAIQGLREDAELLESLMQGQSYFAAERINYELMSLDAPQLCCEASRPEKFNTDPAGLVLRSPKNEDTESLVALQAAYEQEEVLPEHAVFNAAASRVNLERILMSERVLVAEINGQVIGKINTSAESFSRYQIGGVYIRPDCRGHGIGTKMTAAFVQSLLSERKGITLFVKKRNAAAIAVYRKAGFRILADYRISYY